MAWEQRTLGDQYTPMWDPSAGSYYYNSDTGAISYTKPADFDPYASIRAQGIDVNTSTSNPSYSKNGQPGFYYGGAFHSADEARSAAIAGDQAAWDAMSVQGRNPSSGGFLGAMGTGDILQAAGMAAGAYGLGSALAGTSLAGESTGIFAPSATTTADTSLLTAPTAGGVPDTGFGASVNAPGAGVVDTGAAGGTGLTQGAGGVTGLTPGAGVMPGTNIAAGATGLGGAGATTAFGGGINLPFAQSTGALTAAGAATGQAGGGGLLDFLTKAMGGVSPLGAAASIGQALIQGSAAKSAAGTIADAQNRVQSIAQPVTNAQRQPFIGQATQMALNPGQDSFTSAFFDIANKSISAEGARFGNPNLTIANKIPEAIAASQQGYNAMLQNLSTLGGFGINPGYGATSVAQLAPTAANYNFASNQGASALLGGIAGGTGGSNNPFGNVTMSPYGGSTFKV